MTFPVSRVSGGVAIVWVSDDAARERAERDLMRGETPADVLTLATRDDLEEFYGLSCAGLLDGDTIAHEDAAFLLACGYTLPEA